MPRRSAASHPLRARPAAQMKIQTKPGARVRGPAGTSARTRDKRGQATWTSRNTPIAPRASCSRRRVWRCAKGHQRFLPEHLLKVLLDDPRGHGRQPDPGRRRQRQGGAAGDRGSCSGSSPRSRAAAPARSIWRPRPRGCSTRPQQVAKKAGDSFVTVEQLLLALAHERHRRRQGAEDRPACSRRRSTPRSTRCARAAPPRRASAEEGYDALKKYTRDLTEAARAGKLDPVIGRDEEIRRVIQVLSRRTKNNPVLIGEPGVGKTAIAEGLAPAHRQRRRAGIPARPAAAVARPRRPGRRRQVSRRVRGAAEGAAAGGPARRGRHHPVHRRAAHAGRCRQGRGADGRLQHAQAGAGARRAALRRRHHARRVPQAHREGRGPGAALPAGVRRPARRSRTRSRSCAG